jgi:hypothetical protein
LAEEGKRQLPDMQADIPVLNVTVRHPGGRETQTLTLIDSWTALCAAHPVREAQLLQAEIASWAVEQHLCVDWFCDAALFNLRCWHGAEGTALLADWSYPGGIGEWKDTKFGGLEPMMLRLVKVLAEMGPQPPVVPVFNPAMQYPREHFREVQLRLEDYYAAQTKRFLSAGFKESSRVRRRAGARLDHMRWFIKFQILGHSARRIAEKHRGVVSSSAVIKAVRALARALSIPLRSEV